MQNFLSSFLAGFLSTSFLFVMSVIIVFGVKYLRLIIKEFMVQAPSQKVTTAKNPSPPKRKRRKTPSDKRSIEIDASQIDKIYVKKSS